MTDQKTAEEAAINTDRELWRKVRDDYYSPSIHVTESGGIGINVGGHVMVRPVEEWFLATTREAELLAQIEELKALDEQNTVDSGAFERLQGERDELRAEVERLKAGWERAAEVGRQNIKAHFEYERKAEASLAEEQAKLVEHRAIYKRLEASALEQSELLAESQKRVQRLEKALRGIMGDARSHTIPTDSPRHTGWRYVYDTADSALAPGNDEGKALETEVARLNALIDTTDERCAQNVDALLTFNTIPHHYCPRCTHKLEMCAEDLTQGLGEPIL